MQNKILYKHLFLFINIHLVSKNIFFSQSLFFLVFTHILYIFLSTFITVSILFKIMKVCIKNIIFVILKFKII